MKNEKVVVNSKPGLEEEGVERSLERKREGERRRKRRRERRKRKKKRQEKKKKASLNPVLRKFTITLELLRRLGLPIRAFSVIGSLKDSTIQ